jgi:hypothetical protein
VGRDAKPDHRPPNDLVPHHHGDLLTRRR